MGLGKSRVSVLNVNNCETEEQISGTGITAEESLTGDAVSKRSSKSETKSKDASLGSGDGEILNQVSYQSRDELNGGASREASDHECNKTSSKNHHSALSKSSLKNITQGKVKATAQKISENIHATLSKSASHQMSRRRAGPRRSEELCSRNEPPMSSSQSRLATSAHLEERIIKQLVQPKNSDRCTKGRVENQPPHPPPIDFLNNCNDKIEVSNSEDSAEEKLRKLKKFGIPNKLPAHLKELKERFSNDVPKSNHEDSFSAKQIVPPQTHQGKNVESRVKPEETQGFNQSTTGNYFQNKPQESSPTVIIRGAKKCSKTAKCNADKIPEDANAVLVGNTDTNKVVATSGKKRKKCQKVGQKLAADVANSTKLSGEMKQPDGKNGDLPMKVKHKLKSIKTQTSNARLADSGVQTLPCSISKNSQSKQCSKAKKNPKEESTSNVLRILKKVSMDPNKGIREKQELSNNFIQDEKHPSVSPSPEINLLNSSSFTFMEPEHHRSKKHHSSKSHRKSKPGTKSGNHSDTTCLHAAGDSCIYCLPLQVAPSLVKTHQKQSKGKTDSARRIDGTTSNTRLDDTSCGLCTLNLKYPSTEEVLSTCANYATSATTRQEMNLLSSIDSNSNAESKVLSHKGNVMNEELYRQMEELGLGFLRDGEWMPTDVISRTVWQNFEKCADCQATWRRKCNSLAKNNLSLK